MIVREQQIVTMNDACFNQITGRSNIKTITIDFLLLIFLALISRITIFPNLNSFAWFLMDLVVGAILIKKSRFFWDFFRRNILLLAWPFFAILSGLWSINPTLSFYHGVQFGFNAIAGIVVATLLGLKRFLLILRMFGFLFLSLSVIYDFLNPALTRDIAGFFRGVYLHKNELGMFSALQLLICLLLFLQGSYRLFSTICFLIALFTLLKSGSGTSLLVSILMMGIIPLMLQLRKSLFAVSQIFCLAVIFSSSLSLLLIVYDFNPIDFVLLSLGKEPGLTGRDLIWRIGLDAVEDRPLIGHGFLAYWNSTDSTASYLRFVLKQDLVALHNVYLEVAVAFGLIGLVVFVLSILQQVFRGWQFFLTDRGIISLMPLLFILWVSFMCLSENPIFWNSQLNFILMGFAAMNLGLHFDENHPLSRSKARLI